MGITQILRLFFCLLFISSVTACTQKKQITEEEHAYLFSSIEIPDDKISYPEDWPEDLIFPKDFVLLDTSSGLSTESSRQVWTATFKFKGEIKVAGEKILQHFSENGWTESVPNQESNVDIVCFLKKDNSEGLIVLEKDETKNGLTYIMINFFTEP